MRAVDSELPGTFARRACRRQTLRGRCSLRLKIRLASREQKFLRLPPKTLDTATLNQPAAIPPQCLHVDIDAVSPMCRRRSPSILCHRCRSRNATGPSSMRTPSSARRNRCSHSATRSTAVPFGPSIERSIRHSPPRSSLSSSRVFSLRRDDVIAVARRLLLVRLFEVQPIRANLDRPRCRRQLPRLPVAGVFRWLA